MTDHTESGLISKSEGVVKPERPGGFLDYLTPDYIAREQMIRTVERVFRSFGFDPIETPRIEFLKTLAGETSDTGKNIFHIKGSEDDEPLAMPFDHTVPFARLLAANPYNAKKRTGIRLPWRRMVICPVFRADTPQSGRYRQFYQFDADIAGTASMMADAEIVAIMFFTMKALNVERFIIRINNRKILNSLAQAAGIRDRENIKADDISKEMMRILDKLDKIGMEKVLTELKAKPRSNFDPAPAISENDIEKLRLFLNIKGSNQDKLRDCEKLFDGINIAQEGIDELRQVLKYSAGMGVPADVVKIDFSIARGLDYYTGPVMETVLLDAIDFGSVFSGGRYNGLVSRFTGNDLPATGASMGVDRLFAALCRLGVVDHSKLTVTDVMILRLTKDRDIDYLNMASELRSLGLNTEVCLDDDTTFKNQFNFAISRGVGFVIICGEDEFNKGIVQVKNLLTRKQEEIARTDIANYFKK